MSEKHESRGLPSTATGPIPVARYLRMSTENQRYSISNQVKTIARYAREHGMSIVRSYEDLGKSGLDIRERDGLRQLLRDVEDPHVPYAAVLVHDISRWGRFQDPDEAASYELACRRHGVRVLYCAEPFANDGSMSANILVAMKRSMAAEYSRELSDKVFAGHCESVINGFHQGGAAGFALSRQLVDSNRNPVAILLAGQRKYLQADRIILVPTSDHHRQMVNLMYSMLIDEDLPVTHIASRMNALGVYWKAGRPWTWHTVRQVLTNEKYMGTNIYNRKSTRLHTPVKFNPPEEWIRRKNAFEPIVTPERFAQAQEVFKARSSRLGKEPMLARLKDLLARHGKLSARLVESEPDSPGRLTYTRHFGTLRNAFLLAGYEPKRDTAFVECNRRARHLQTQLVAEVVRGIEAAGGFAVADNEHGPIRVNGELSVSVVILTAGPIHGHREWRVQRPDPDSADISIYVRLDEANEKPFDYYIIPALDRPTTDRPLHEANGRDVDAYRFQSLDLFFALMARAPAEATEPQSRRTLELFTPVSPSVCKDYRLDHVKLGGKGTYKLRMGPTDLTRQYQRIAPQHRAFHAKAVNALSRLHATRAALLELLNDHDCVTLIGASASSTIPELLRCWGRHVEVVA